MDGWAEPNDDAGSAARHLRYLVERIWDVAGGLRGHVRPSRSEDLVLSLLLLRRIECLGAADGRAVALSLGQLRRGFDAADEFDAELPPDLASVLRVLEFRAALEEVSPPEVAHMAISSISSLDLSPKSVPAEAMIDVVNEVIRRHRRASDMPPDDTTTPVDVARLLAELLVVDVRDADAGRPPRVFDPACGTGTLLIAARRRINELSPGPWGAVTTSGQDVNVRAVAVARLIALAAPDPAMDVRLGDSLSEPDHRRTADYAICNPPFGATWKRVSDEVRHQHEQGRFTAGLPRLSDSQFLFLQHALEEVDRAHGETPRGRVAILMSGSALFAGETRSGENEIRRYVVEHDLLDCIVALPRNLLFHTSIPVFVWLLDRHKPKHRRGRVQFIDASGDDAPRKRGLSPARIARITQAYAEMDDLPGFSRVVTGDELGYVRITVERPLRLRFRFSEDGMRRIVDGQPKLLPVMQALQKTFEPTEVSWRQASEQVDALLTARMWTLTRPERDAVREAFTERDPHAAAVPSERGGWEPDPELRVYERVPLTENVDEYFEREVVPHIPDAWISNAQIGYDFSFGPLFPQATAEPRPLEDINSDLRAVKARFDDLFAQLL
jgi:type I restriction enzyme M protein